MVASTSHARKTACISLLVQFAGLSLYFFAVLCALFASFAVKQHCNRKERKVDAKNRKDKLLQYLHLDFGL